MTFEDDLPALLPSTFGPEGLRRWEPAAVDGFGLTTAAQELLTGTGVPAAVGAYFQGTPVGRPAAADVGGARWLLLGTDNGAGLAVRPGDDGGGVWALLPSTVWGPTRRVATSVPRFLASLALFDRALPRLAEAAGTDVAGAEWRRVRDGLAEIDPQVFAEPEGWWTRVLEDVRHTMSFPFSAAVKIDDRRGGGPRVLTATARLGLAHPEMQLAAKMRAIKADPGTAVELFTELEACLSPGHYCRIRAAAAFPRAAYTYAFPYSGDAAQRDESVAAAATKAADFAADTGNANG